ncbi:hypothetical protein [Brevundimonas bacteroides]|uniref:hypothetical protein n=1 Tax=Brevundimonas bacteroides TaxID=74311 RepID=UPI0004970C5D|nr:hypothetical protein [Brevundimonas bacteroides]
MTHSPSRRLLATLTVVASAAALGAALLPATAEAQSRERQRFSTFQGPRVTADRQADIFRSRGSASIERSGQINGQPWASSRYRSSARTDDGYVSSTSRTGRSGVTQSWSRDVSVDDGYYNRSASGQSSTGRGYGREVTALDTGDSVVVTRELTTNGGETRSSSTVRPY